MLLHFSKYQGTGNDFVMIDDRANTFDHTDHKLIADLCDRRFGIGSDGLILLRSHEDYGFEMLYFNADVYEGSMCGNGGRCIVQFAHDLYIVDQYTTFIAVDGEHKAEVKGGLIHLKMSDVAEYEQNEDHYFLDTGSPHYTQFVDNLENFEVVLEGKAIRNNERFRAEGTNVNFIEKVENGLFVRTYERGVEDETLACGTGVTACALSYSLQGGESPVAIKVLGGQLKVSFDKTEKGFSNIYLIGPAQKVFEGEVEV